MKRLIIYVGAFLLLIAVTAFSLSQDVGGNSSTNNNLDLPFDAREADDIEEDAAEIIYFYGQQYEGDVFVFCVDNEKENVLFYQPVFLMFLNLLVNSQESFLIHLTLIF